MSNDFNFDKEIIELAKYLPENIGAKFVEYALVSQFARDVLKCKIETETEMKLTLSFILCYGLVKFGKDGISVDDDERNYPE